MIIISFFSGVKGTKCSLDITKNNNPCDSLYNAICDGQHCKCPPNSREDKNLRRCVAGKPSGGSHDDFSDLPFDYVPDTKPKSEGNVKPAAGGGTHDFRGRTTPVPIHNRPTYPPRSPPKQPAPSGGFNNNYQTNLHGGGGNTYPKQTNNNYPFNPNNYGYQKPGRSKPPCLSCSQQPGYPVQPGYPQPGYPANPDLYPQHSGGEHHNQNPHYSGGYPGYGYPTRPGRTHYHGKDKD